MCNNTIGIIDSGIGGVSVLKQLINRFKEGNYIYFADNLYIPYGNKSKDFVEKRVDYIIRLLQNKYKVNTIIIACNTASTCINTKLYNNVYTMQFNSNDTYLATNLTKQNMPHLNIISDNLLAQEIENNIFNKEKLINIINTCIKQNNLNKYKNIILGCTHYELVADIFTKLAPKTNFINNSSSIVDLISINPIKELNIALLTSKHSNIFNNKFYKLLD